MGEFSIWHWLVVLLVVMLLFGGNKVSGLMGDFAKGIKAFKKNMADEPDSAANAGAERPSASIPGALDAAAPHTPARETTPAH
jgi:sec-independent protein translocase protein TatA